MWFRDDLRIRDNPALAWAAQRGPLVALLIDESSAATGTRPLGAAARWWWGRSVEKLSESLAVLGVPLLHRSGDPARIVPEVAGAVGAAAVTWNRRYHAPLREMDARMKADLRERGLEVHSHPGFLLTEPWEVATASGTPYKVYTPFARAAFGLAAEHADALGDPEPAALHGDGAVAEVPEAAEPGWAGGLAELWTPGEQGARERLDSFMEGIDGYASGRDNIAAHATSGLSPHLRFGEISVLRVWASISGAGEDAGVFLGELLWRDFAWHRLYELPDMATRNVRPQFDRFGWAWDASEIGKLCDGRNPLNATGDDSFHRDFAAWRAGRTGIPLVDAGMRELWATGTMHNRVRMVVASFLTKNLQIHWRHGEQWFWETLVDADPASNPFNWQWAAGSGDDAAPYFRIFNPETQAKKFDPEGIYVRRWIPEYGTDGYPEPIVDLKESRRAALDAYEAVKQG